MNFAGVRAISVAYTKPTSAMLYTMNSTILMMVVMKSCFMVRLDGLMRRAGAVLCVGVIGILLWGG
jgi:hypothetical protein